jgi:hypothetical protein
VTKVQVLNRGDCCGKRLNGAKVFIGENLCGKISNAKEGKWIDVNCKVSGTFIKIQGKPDKALHFCGLKIWTVSDSEDVMEED